MRTLVPFWIVIPYSERLLKSGPTKTSQYLMLPLPVQANSRTGEADRVSIGIPLFYSKPEAFEEARKMALQAREIPVVCEMLAYVEIPQDVKVVTKFFNAEGELVTHDPKG